MWSQKLLEFQPPVHFPAHVQYFVMNTYINSSLLTQHRGALPMRTKMSTVTAIVFVLVLAQVCQGNREIEILHGSIPSNVIFAHFDPVHPVTVRQILSSRKGALWMPGDMVMVFENGQEGQNAEMLRFSGDKWLPANIDPVHRIDNVYRIIRSASSSGTILLKLPTNVNLQEPPVIPTTHRYTLGAGVGMIRKSGTAESVHVPLGVRLNNIQDTPTANVQITYP